MISVGVAKLDITPPVGVELTGYVAREGPSKGVLDKLYTRALCLEASGTRTLIIANDVLALDAAFVDDIKAQLHERLVIPAERIVITATHTHSGPATIDLRGCGSRSVEWLEVFQRKILEAAEASTQKVEPARAAFASFSSPGIRNRRKIEGFVDEMGCIIQLRGAKERPLATLVNYGCHPVVLRANNLLISGDYAGRVCALVEEDQGGLGIFLTGSAGDIDPSVVGSVEAMNSFGEAVTRAALEALSRSRYLNDSIALRSKVVEVASEELPATEDLSLSTLTRQVQPIKSPELREKVLSVYRRWAKDVTALKKAGTGNVKYHLNLAVLTLGDVSLVFLPGEPFAALGARIKKACAPRMACVVSLANGCLGYLPSADAYVEGGYEIEFAHRYYGAPAAVSREAEETIVNTVKSLL